MKGRSKVSKMHFWMIQNAKKEVFGHFLDLGLLDWLDIAYYDRTKCVSTFGNTTRSWRIIQKFHESIFEWSKVPKEVFRHYLEFGLLDWLDITFDDRTICFLTFADTTRSWRIIQKSQRSIFVCSQVLKMRFLAIVLSFVSWIDLVLHIMDRTTCLHAHSKVSRNPCLPLALHKV